MDTIDNILPHIKLKFAVEHPTLEECYAFGYECATYDLPEEVNPFQANTRECEFWCEGWWAGFYGEEPVYKNTETSHAHANLDSIMARVSVDDAANDGAYKYDLSTLVNLGTVEIGGAVAAMMLVGYQLIELVI